MGYTHYWRWKKDVKDIEDYQAKFKKAVRETKKCIDRIPSLYCAENACGRFKQRFSLCGPDGQGKPVYSDTEISFNGNADTGDDYETFCIYITDESGMSFCKTARMPYDVAVCIALICFKKAFGDDFVFSSDGDIKSGEQGWAIAKSMTSYYVWY